MYTCVLYTCMLFRGSASTRIGRADRSLSRATGFVSHAMLWQTFRARTETRLRRSCSTLATDVGPNQVSRTEPAAGCLRVMRFFAARTPQEPEDEVGAFRSTQNMLRRAQGHVSRV